MKITDVGPPLDKHKSEPLHRFRTSFSGIYKTPKIDDDEEDSETEPEINIWIDFWDTPYPRLRDSIINSKEEVKVQEVEMEPEHHSNTEEDNDSFRVPNSSQKANKDRANSEKFVSQKKLLNEKAVTVLTSSTPTKGNFFLFYSL